MNTCPNCGKVAGLHSSILQGCMCQYSMQAPPQRTWVGLTDMEKQMLINKHEGVAWEIANAVEQQIKEKNK